MRGKNAEQVVKQHGTKIVAFIAPLRAKGLHYDQIEAPFRRWSRENLGEERSLNSVRGPLRRSGLLPPAKRWTRREKPAENGNGTPPAAQTISADCPPAPRPVGDEGVCLAAADILTDPTLSPPDRLRMAAALLRRF